MVIFHINNIMNINFNIILIISWFLPWVQFVAICIELSKLATLMVFVKTIGGQKNFPESAEKLPHEFATLQPTQVSKNAGLRCTWRIIPGIVSTVVRITPIHYRHEVRPFGRGPTSPLKGLTITMIISHWTIHWEPIHQVGWDLHGSILDQFPNKTHICRQPTNQ